MATSGHNMPPSRPTELATPTPVDLTEVGYIWCDTEFNLSIIKLFSLSVSKRIVITSGVYMYMTVKLPEMQARAPKRRIMVNNQLCWKSNGIRKIKLEKNMDAIVILRPILSTSKAASRSPGSSEKKKKVR